MCMCISTKVFPADNARKLCDAQESSSCLVFNSAQTNVLYANKCTPCFLTLNVQNNKHLVLKRSQRGCSKRSHQRHWIPAALALGAPVSPQHGRYGELYAEQQHMSCASRPFSTLCRNLRASFHTICTTPED